MLLGSYIKWSIGWEFQERSPGILTITGRWSLLPKKNRFLKILLCQKFYLLFYFPNSNFIENISFPFTKKINGNFETTIVGTKLIQPKWMQTNIRSPKTISFSLYTTCKHVDLPTRLLRGLVTKHLHTRVFKCGLVQVVKITGFWEVHGEFNFFHLGF